MCIRQKPKKGNTSSLPQPSDIRKTTAHIIVKISFRNRRRNEEKEVMPLGKASPYQVIRSGIMVDEDPALYTCGSPAPQRQVVQSIQRFGFRHFRNLWKKDHSAHVAFCLRAGTPPRRPWRRRRSYDRRTNAGGNGVSLSKSWSGFIWLGHYQQSERIILSLCDELGILVWKTSGARGGLGGAAQSGTSQTNVDEHDSIRL